MPTELTPNVMDNIANVMLKKAMKNYEKNGVLLEAIMLINKDGLAAIATNGSDSAWYKNPEGVVNAIRERESVAAVFVTPAYTAIRGSDGQEESVGEMVLVYAVHPQGNYRQQLVAEVVTTDGKIKCQPKQVSTLHIPEQLVGWLDVALG